jgi:hypothetical protein
MNCAGIKELLSEYIDGVLDAQTEAQIKKHTAACAGCRKEMEELKTLVENIGSFQQAKAPDDFLDQLHERIEPRFGLRKMINTLFVPMRIKIPVQLVTATATAVLVFSIIHLPQPKKQVEEELLNDASKISEKQEVKPTLMKEPTELPPEREAYAPKPSAQEIKANKKSKTRKVAPTSLNRLKTEKVVKLALVLKTRPDQKLPSKIAPIKAAPPDESSSSFQSRMAGKSAAKEEMAADAIKNDKKLKTPSTAEPLAVNEKTGRAGAKADQLTKKLKKIVSDLKGEIKSIQYDPKTGHPVFLKATISAEKYSDFYEGLKEIGDFHDPSPTPSPTIDEKKKEMIKIELTILK